MKNVESYAAVALKFQVKFKRQLNSLLATDILCLLISKFEKLRGKCMINLLSARENLDGESFRVGEYALETLDVNLAKQRNSLYTDEPV